ncbi:MAG: hypothetical protein Q8M31_07295 [Beijerinckiaceae bacterium]|nr:hypothetical protein [Beijerinckiaceae bacterium]
MEGADNQWIGLGSVFLLGLMVISPFVFTWKYCDRPEAYLKRCLRTTITSAIVIAVSAVLLLLFFASHFPDGAVLAKVKDTAGQGLIAAVMAPLFGTDFLMRMKLKYRWHKVKGSTEV